MDGGGWNDIEQVSFKFDQGFLLLTTNNWEQGKFYDVRVLLSTSNDGMFDSIEYYGFTVKGKSGKNYRFKRKCFFQYEIVNVQTC